MSENNVVDIFELAVAIDAGESQMITLLGCDLSVRRNYTAKEVHEIIGLFTPDNAEMLLDELAKILVDKVSDSTKEEKEAFVEKLISLSLPEFTRVHIALTKVAGLRGEDGNFLTA